MPSTVSTPVGVRIPNRQINELRVVAHQRGTTVSALIAGLVTQELPRLRAA
jgi:hypothetical protein